MCEQRKRLYGKKAYKLFPYFSTADAQGGSAVLKSVRLKDSRTLGLEFGNEKTADTYLQLSKTLSEIPQTIEASIKSSVEITDSWLLRAGGDKSNVIGGISKDSITAGTTTDSDTPGAGKGYIEFKSNGNTLTAYSSNLGIAAGDYGIDRLAVAFWTYSETEGKLFEGGQLRLSNKAAGEDGKPIFHITQTPLTFRQAGIILNCR